MTVDVNVYQALEKWLAKVKSHLCDNGWWSTDHPEPYLLCSSTPFAADTLPFVQWLQWVFIPKLAMIVQCRQRLPAGCCIQPYAEEVLKRDAQFASNPVAMSILIVLMGEVDQLLS